jgi:hypothetical protein
MTALNRAPGGACPFPLDVLKRIDSGELKLKMNTDERKLTIGAGCDA